MYRPKHLLTIGQLTQLNRPACMPHQPLQAHLFSHDPATLPIAAMQAEAIALQLLQQHGTGEAKLLLFEAAASAHFVQIKRLFAASDNQWGEQFFTAKSCLQYLSELEELTHRRFALLAQAAASDIHQYNAQSVHAEPVIYLLLSGLGATLSESQPLQQLQLLCEQGPKVGIVPILLHNSAETANPQLADFRCQALNSFWQTLAQQAQGLLCTPKVQGLNWPTGAWALLERFGLDLTIEAKQVTGWTDQLLAQSSDEQATDSNQDFLHLAIGLSGATAVHFSMGERSDAYHALIGGATRTGKTTLLNNLILSACEQYTPEQLQLTLMDFKDGVSFWEYEGLAHVTQLYAPVMDDFDSALLMLEQFEAQISQRYQLFRSQRTARLADYNACCEQPLARCLLIIDEAQSLFEGRDYKQKAPLKRLLSNIAKKGAAAGMHIILSTQSFQNVELDGDVRDQFHLRIGLRHASAMGCRALMGRDNEAMLHLPRFSAIYNAHQGDTKYNRTVALDDVLDFHGRLDVLKQQYPAVESSQSIPDKNVAVQLDKDAQALVSESNLYADGDVDGEW